MERMAATLAEYRLDRRIGSGASGEVFEASPPGGGEPLAVKVIFSHLSESDDNVARFERQCRLLATIDHPAVVPVSSWGFCEERRQLFLAMPLLRGRTLGEWMREAESTLELVELFDMALQGLAAAHERGLVHRDIKPDNIFVVEGERPEARVIDFGLVRQVDATGPTATQMGLGTPSYMAPEQATSARSVGVAADVWSSGVVLYRIVSGRLPFTGEGPYETMIRVVSTPPPPLPNVPEPLQALIFRCLQKEPERRPPDATAVRSELAAALEAPGVRDWLDAKAWHGGTEPSVEPLDPTFIQDATDAATRTQPARRAEHVGASVPDRPAPIRRAWVPWAWAAVALSALGLGTGPLWWPAGDRVEALPTAEAPSAAEAAPAPLPDALLPVGSSEEEAKKAEGRKAGERKPEASDAPAERDVTRRRTAPARRRPARTTRSDGPEGSERTGANATPPTPEPRSEGESARPEASASESATPPASRSTSGTDAAAVEAKPPSAEPPPSPSEPAEAPPAPPPEKDEEPEVDPRDILTF